LSLVAPGLTGFQSIYRLVSPTVNVKHGALSANQKFNTNIPFDYAMLIYRTEWGIAAKDQPNSAANDWQVTCELTENGAATTASNTDPLIIDDAFYEERVQWDTAVGGVLTARNPFRENFKDFLVQFGGTYPSVAQQFNIVASMVELVGSGPGTNGVDVFCNIFYTLSPVTAALRDYLTKRQQIQR
jgi:hypothetical protein